MSPAHGLRRRLVSRMPSMHHEHDLYRWWVLANVMIGTFMAVLDFTIVNVALPKLMASFGVDVEKVEWVVTAYMLVFAVMLPTSGWIADHFGFRRTYFTALLLFTVGSLLCGLAWNEDVLIVFRIVQGTGAGLMMPVGMAIITHEFPVEQRGLALGFWGIAAAASVSLGPLIGGWLVDSVSWHAIFGVNVPVGAVALIATLVIQREHKTGHTGKFDLPGFLSMSIFLCALLLALSDGNASWNTGGWTSPFILGCLAVAAVALVVFIVTNRATAHPIIELDLLRNFNFAVTNGVLFLFGLGMFGSTFLLPLYLQNSLGYTALQAGAVFLPVGLLQAVCSPLSGKLSDKFSPKLPATIGMVLLAVSLYMNASLSLYSERADIMWPLIIRGIGMGLIFTPLTALALAGVPKPRLAQASGLFNVIRQIGGSFGVAILSTMLTRRMIHHMAAFGQSVDQGAPAFQNIVHGLQHFVQYTAGGTMSLASMRASAMIGEHVAQQAFVRAVNDDFLIAAIISFAGLIPIFFLRGPKHSKGGDKVVAME